MIADDEILNILKYRLDKLEVLEEKIKKLEKNIPRKNCDTCSCIGCNNSMEWECNPGQDAKHWNPSLATLKLMYATDTKKAFFVLDTAEEKNLRISRNLTKSAFKEPYESKEENNPWLKQIYSGKVFVNDSFEEDKYGVFIYGHAPIYNSDNKIVGFSGVDVDVGFFKEWEEKIRNSMYFSLLFCFIISLVISYYAYRIHKVNYLMILEKNKEALTDALTELPNRRAFEEISTIILNKIKAKKMQASLLLFDIDNFKKINDVYGHNVGDEVLKSFALLLSELSQEEDFVARIGGEEFVVILKKSDNRGAQKYGERIRTYFEKNSILENQEYKINITISGGISELNSTDETIYDTLKRADMNLYKAKNNGRNQIVSSML